MSGSLIVLVLLLDCDTFVRNQEPCSGDTFPIPWLAQIRFRNALADPPFLFPSYSLYSFNWNSTTPFIDPFIDTLGNQHLPSLEIE